MEEVTVSKPMFGGKIEFVVYDAPEEIVKPVLEEVYAEGLRLQKIFNMYDPKSELSLLNKQRNLKVSKELLEVLQKALSLSELTEGNYDISLGKRILARKKGEKTEVMCDYKNIKISCEEVSLTHPDVMIDLGSIAKGYIADKLTEMLLEKGVEEFLIDARGDIRVSGKRDHVMGIQHPRKEGEICSIKIKNEAVATSGDYMQYTENFNMSHIINQKEVFSVTVVAPTLEEADAYATVIFTSPAKERTKMIKSNKRIKVLIFGEDDRMMMSNNFEEMICGGKNEN